MSKTTACRLAQLISYVGIVVLCTIPSNSSAADVIEDGIDNLVVQKVKPDSPGCAVIVIDDGRIVFKRGYGIANMGSGLPITAATAFNIESVSKQFTAACIALLVEKGKISLDDDIRKYLPEMPVYECPIKIKHLIHHTSGIRDFEILRSLKGIPLDDSCSEQGLLDLIARQKQLNFRPGDMKRYSNSGYFLLGVIVKRVTGMSVGEYAQKHLFAPLGMTHTGYHYDPVRTAGNLAVPHVSDGAGKYHAQPVAPHVNDFGYGGIHTTVEDLYLWDQNFFRNKVGGENFNTLMLTRGVLNNGDTIDYAFGLKAGTHRGLKTWRRKFSVICLANYPLNTGKLSYEIADLYLGIQKEARKETTVSVTDTVTEVDPAVFAGLEGKYRAHDATLVVSTRDNRLYVQPPDAGPLELHPKSTTEYFLKGVDVQVSFDRDENGTISRLVWHQNGHHIPADKLDRRPLQRRAERDLRSVREP